MSLFDAHADRYDQWYQTELGQYADGVEKEMLVRELLPQVEETALDLGCGTGAIGIWLAKFGVEVVGVDASVYMLDQAK